MFVQHTERHHTQHYPYHNSSINTISTTNTISSINTRSTINTLSTIIPCLIRTWTTTISCCMTLIKTCCCLQSVLLPYQTPGYQSTGSIKLVLPRHAHLIQIAVHTLMVQIIEIEEMNANDKNKKSTRLILYPTYTHAGANTHTHITYLSVYTMPILFLFISTHSIAKLCSISTANSRFIYLHAHIHYI